jgi:hypothetical protein
MGLGDFVGGIADAAGDIAEDIGGAAVNTAKGVGFVATHLDDAAKGVGKGLGFAANYVGEAAKGVGWLAQHPGYWDDAAKSMIVDQFTDPVNIATNLGMLGLTIATGGAAAPAWMAKVGLGAKAGAEAIEGVTTAAKVADTALDVAKGAKSLSRAERFAKGLDEVITAPSSIAKSVRSTVTGGLEKMTGGLVKQNELSAITRGRGALAEGFLARTGGVEEGTGALEWGRQWAGRAIAGAPGAPTTGGGLAQLNYRANQVSDTVRGVRDARSNIQDFATGVQFLADPKKATINFAQAHKSDIAEFVTEHAGSAALNYAKKKLFGGGEEEKAPQPAQVVQGMPDLTSDWQRSTDSGGFVGKKRGPETQRLGTVEQTTVPASYGNYKSGRGFSSWDQQASGMSASPWTQDPAYT